MPEAKTFLNMISSNEEIGCVIHFENKEATGPEVVGVDLVTPGVVCPD